MDELIEKYNKFKLDLNDCFYHFFNAKTEKSDEFCPECDNYIPCSSKTYLYKAPEYLIIVLNHKKNRKLAVNYDEYINISRYTHDQECQYRLVGVVLHIGNSLTFNHYIACCLNSDLNNEEKFYLFNDDSVYDCSFNKIKEINYSPYILFYEKYSLNKFH